MDEIKNKSIAETFKSKMKAPWVWLIIVLTLGLTALFYMAQNPQVIVYNQYIKNHAEYQLQEAKMMRSLERVRVGKMSDSTMIVSQIMMIREMVSSFSHDMNELGKMKIELPPASSVNRFEREVSRKLSGITWYLINRSGWFHARDSLMAQAQNLPSASMEGLMNLVDSASAGYAVVRSAQLDLPEPLAAKVDSLLAQNADLAAVWNRFDNEVTMACSEELSQFFMMRNMETISLKSKIPTVFYFLSIVLLLSTFFFMFRAKP